MKVTGFAQSQSKTSTHDAQFNPINLDAIRLQMDGVHYFGNLEIVSNPISNELSYRVINPLEKEHVGTTMLPSNIRLREEAVYSFDVDSEDCATALVDDVLRKSKIDTVMPLSRSTGSFVGLDNTDQPSIAVSDTHMTFEPINEKLIGTNKIMLDCITEEVSKPSDALKQTVSGNLVAVSQDALTKIQNTSQQLPAFKSSEFDPPYGIHRPTRIKVAALFNELDMQINTFAVKLERVFKDGAVEDFKFSLESVEPYPAK